MSFVDKIKQYKETKALEKKEECIDMIKRKIFRSIDKDPLNEYIILLYDDEFEEGMDKYITEYLTKKGLIVKHYREHLKGKMLGQYEPRVTGLALAFREQKTNNTDFVVYYV